jgi:hypothetical protein
MDPERVMLSETSFVIISEPWGRRKYVLQKRKVNDVLTQKNTIQNTPTQFTLLQQTFRYQ